MVKLKGEWARLVDVERIMCATFAAEVVDDLIEKARACGHIKRTAEEMKAQDEETNAAVAKMWEEVRSGRR